MSLQKLAEEKVGFLIVFVLLVISFGLLIEIVPLFFSKSVTEPAPGVKPYTLCKLRVAMSTSVKAVTPATHK